MNPMTNCATSRAASLRYKLVKPAVVALMGTLSLSAISAHAAVISAWDFNPIVSGGNWGDSPYAPSVTVANETIGGITRNWTTGSGTAAGHAWGGNNFSITATDKEAAIAANDFATFSLTAAPGHELSLSGIDAYNIRRSATGPSTGIWQYEIGAGPFVDIGGPITWGGTTSASGNAQAAIDLSAISALQHVASGVPLTFRVVAWGASNIGGTWYLNDPAASSANDLVVNGSVNAVPEPASLGAAAIAGLCLLANRRARTH